MIVERHLQGETLSAIGADLGISRQRAQRLFVRGATDEEYRRARPPREKRVPREKLNLVRVQIFLSSALKSRAPSQAEIRAAVNRALENETIPPDMDTSLDTRMNVLLDADQKIRFEALCETNGVSLSAGLRGVMASI